LNGWIERFDEKVSYDIYSVLAANQRSVFGRWQVDAISQDRLPLTM